MSRYRSGYRLECRVRDLLRRKGYIVVRSAGSRGPVDLLAAKDGQILAIQVRKSGRLTPDEKAVLFKVAEHFRAVPLVATVREGRIVFEGVTPGCR